MPYTECAGGCGKEIKTRIGRRSQTHCGDPCVPGEEKIEEVSEQPRLKQAPEREAVDDERLDLGG